MTALWSVWSHKDGVVAITDMTTEQWAEIQDAAGIHSVYGPKSDTLVADELGHLYLIDNCGMARHVEPSRFVAAPVMHGPWVSVTVPAPDLQEREGELRDALAALTAPAGQRDEETSHEK